MTGRPVEEIKQDDYLLNSGFGGGVRVGITMEIFGVDGKTEGLPNKVKVVDTFYFLSAIGAYPYELNFEKEGFIPLFQLNKGVIWHGDITYFIKQKREEANKPVGFVPLSNSVDGVLEELSSYKAQNIEKVVSIHLPKTIVDLSRGNLFIYTPPKA
ncbi:hypothetical protein KY358_02760 [Candidatus Woesearchaeota archaeon]|nr:hypothetical protein [Candidatus Woesearchaeota archaeon]